MTPQRISATVYLVGAGPGAPDLLTLRAASLLERADIVFYDALVHPETVALARRARKIEVGKRCGKRATAQRFINVRLIDAAQRYAVVVRLKGGDPMLFGRAQEEIAALRARNIAVEVVPGISAAFSASAELGQSLTERGVSRNVVFATPRIGRGESSHDWARAAAAGDTVVLYMASREAGAVCSALIAAGVSPARPAVFVENASLSTSRVISTRVIDLPQAAAQLGEGPALLLIGEVYEDIVNTSQNYLAGVALSA